ncbi:MAG: DUF362 domain-containing protein [Desulfobacterales bacterium]|jgi:uncharacterized protein (DUF362 family)|nr:hypothetical protein [Desulfobacter sp.]MDP6395019.1 DUF362 domain-containing protein [Desulfobacterales bacterium]MDP6683074.1 DUF362 domain-containing protein [Desulfobacterales bacterium]MDP6806505.1 DUF362 domain-containing protein [Desulfobacterales bacterium]|tara:strand:- start:154860 stop:156182 length:1323 start_codon:yes stop_codon:yes gene_type:complete
MKKSKVAIVAYEKPLRSVRKAVALSNGMDRLPAKAKVFIKPNIVFWTRATAFPKWGVITTSRVIEDMVIILKERGIDDITIGEGTVMRKPRDKETPAHAFETLGYRVLKDRYGVKAISIFDRPFEKIDLGKGVALNFNADILHSDFVVNIPVLKTHAMTTVSLGIKNLKGMIDIPSRKKCHNTHPEKDLHFMVARLADKMPPMFTLIDGIYSLEKGPSFDGRMRRSNLLVASSDVLSADMVGAGVLGYQPSEVQHLANTANNRDRPYDLSDVEVVGKSIESATSHHRYDFPYNKDDTLPLPMEKMGIQGLSFKKYDLSLCTYCSGLIGPALTSIAFAWRGEPWDDVEILNGKVMAPTPGKKKTVLFGKCMYQLNKDHPDIQEMIAIKGCPPTPMSIEEALNKAGIKVDPAFYKNIEQLPGYFLKRYEDKPEFDESFFRIK